MVDLFDIQVLQMIHRRLLKLPVLLLSSLAPPLTRTSHGLVPVGSRLRSLHPDLQLKVIGIPIERRSTILIFELVPVLFESSSQGHILSACAIACHTDILSGLQ
jgi:hypothetical protein